MISEGRISFITETSVMVRRYLHDTDTFTPPSVFYQPVRSASERLADLIGQGIFDFPKDEAVVRQFIEMATDAADPDVIILDFFAGSGTTAQAVLELNRADGGQRRFVLVQLPEPTGREDFPTIAEITKERVRRVLQKMTAEIAAKERKEVEEELPLEPSESLRSLRSFAANPDLGFKVFKLAESNFAIWNPALAATTPEGLAVQWKLSADNVRADAGETALLYELALKSGLPLHAPAVAHDAAGARVWLLDEGRKLLCLARALNREQLRAMADLKPQSVLCLGTVFQGNDALKVNANLEFQSHGIQFATA